jgi:prevent-host-death family protein
MIWEVKMIKISATKLRNNFFNYLDKASAGETIVIQRNNQDVARIVPTHQIDWRDKMSIKPELLVSPEEFIKPIEDIWEEYV